MPRNCFIEYTRVHACAHTRRNTSLIIRQPVVRHVFSSQQIYCEADENLDIGSHIYAASNDIVTKITNANFHFFSFCFFLTLTSTATLEEVEEQFE